MLVDLPHIVDLLHVQDRRRCLVEANLLRSNAKRRAYDYRVRDNVLLRVHSPNKLGERAIGPFPITCVYTNSTVDICRTPNTVERLNIRRLHPFRS